MKGRVLPSSNSARAPATWREVSESSVATCWTSEGESTAFGGRCVEAGMAAARRRVPKRARKVVPFPGEGKPLTGPEIPFQGGYTGQIWRVLIETGEADERDRRGAV